MNTESWVCIHCRQEEPASVLQPSIDPAYRVGRCLVCHTLRVFGHPTGDELKMAGIAAVNGARSNGAVDWKINAARAIRDLAAQRIYFTANDVTALVGLPEHRNAVGAALSGAARRGIIRRVGFQKGKRPSQHARVVAKWEGI